MAFHSRARLWTILLAAALCFATHALTQEIDREPLPDLFQFTVSYDSPANLTNPSPWLEAPAGNHGQGRVE